MRKIHRRGGRTPERCLICHQKVPRSRMTSHMERYHLMTAAEWEALDVLDEDEIYAGCRPYKREMKKRRRAIREIVELRRLLRVPDLRKEALAKSREPQL